MWPPPLFCPLGAILGYFLKILEWFKLEISQEVFSHHKRNILKIREKKGSETLEITSKRLGEIFEDYSSAECFFYFNFLKI